jgi:hypothetical protein
VHLGRPVEHVAIRPRAEELAEPGDVDGGEPVRHDARLPAVGTGCEERFVDRVEVGKKNSPSTARC